MRTVSRLSTLGLLVVLSATSAASAQQPPEGSFSQKPGVEVGGDANGDGGGGAAGVPFIWEQRWDEVGICNAGNENIPIGQVDGRGFRYVLIDLRSEQVVDATQWYCLGPLDAEPPPPPLPPSPEQVWDHTPIPLPVVNISPEVFGVTGLDTWLWYTQGTEVTAAVNVGGWHAEVTAHLVGYEFDMGNGDTVGDTWRPTEANPYTYVYTHTCGDCVVTARTTWSGSYTATHPALTTALVVDLGTRAFAGSRDYRVREIEAVIGDGEPNDD